MKTQMAVAALLMAASTLVGCSSDPGVSEELGSSSSHEEKPADAPYTFAEDTTFELVYPRGSHAGDVSILAYSQACDPYMETQGAPGTSLAYHRVSLLRLDVPRCTMMVQFDESDDLAWMCSFEDDAYTCRHMSDPTGNGLPSLHASWLKALGDCVQGELDAGHSPNEAEDTCRASKP